MTEQISIEQEEIPRSNEDIEFDQLERLPDLTERAGLTHILFEEIVRDGRWIGKIREGRVDGSESAVLRLPNPDTLDSPQAITEVHDNPHRGYYFYETPERRKLIGYNEARQGHLWHFFANQPVYIQFSMSECSALYGKNPAGEFFATHLAFSSRSETVAALQYLSDNAVDQSQIWLLASLPRSIEDQIQFAKNQSDRLNHIEDYLALGLAREQIYPFYYHWEEADLKYPGSARNHIGLVQVIAHPDFIYRYSFDTRWDPDIRREHISDYRDQTVIDLRS